MPATQEVSDRLDGLRNKHAYFIRLLSDYDDSLFGLDKSAIDATLIDSADQKLNAAKDELSRIDVDKGNIDQVVDFLKRRWNLNNAFGDLSVERIMNMFFANDSHGKSLYSSEQCKFYIQRNPDVVESLRAIKGLVSGFEGPYSIYPHLSNSDQNLLRLIEKYVTFDYKKPEQVLDADYSVVDTNHAHTVPEAHEDAIVVQETHHRQASGKTETEHTGRDSIEERVLQLNDIPKSDSKTGSQEGYAGIIRPLVEEKFEPGDSRQDADPAKTDTLYEKIERLIQDRYELRMQKLEETVRRLEDQKKDLESRLHDLEKNYNAKPHDGIHVDFTEKKYAEDISRFVDYRNSHSLYGLKRVVKEAGLDWLKSEDLAKEVLKYAMQNSHYISRYDCSLAPDGMKDEMLAQYCCNYGKSLDEIAQDLSKKYNMNISISTIRKYARSCLGSGISRKDKSAYLAYASKNKEKIDAFSGKSTSG